MNAMLGKTLAWAAAAVFVAGPVSADWVTLKDGRRVRGIDYRPCPKGHLFTVEDGRIAFIKADQVVSHEKSPPGEKVEFRGAQATLRAKINALRKEREAYHAEMRDAIAAWARGGKNAEERRAFVMAQAAAEQELHFGRTLAESRLTTARRLAARELERFRTDHATGALAVAMIADKDADVRASALAALEKRRDPKTGEHCIPYLLSADKDLRIRSSMALQAFPTIRAVPSLFLTIHKIWTGGQRSYFFQGAMRAYIGDYELVSGGTAYTLTEAADPIVRFSETGVVLDVKIARSEETIHIQTLETITGRSFGKDAGKWREWWKTAGEAEFARALAAPKAGARPETPPGAPQ
ncbi:MAG TPA: hypothetical protein DCM87_08240 [Planctomycetes bacterium]|nr:hypothetical protein [Planctomycetota bacterium]